jgi:EamA domain-containing membrane protein RarD
MTLNQLSLNTRALAATLASSTTLDPVVSVALGLALFDEHLHASALQAAVGLVALAAALLGVVVLAWAEVPNTIATS